MRDAFLSKYKCLNFVYKDLFIYIYIYIHFHLLLAHVNPFFLKKKCSRVRAAQGTSLLRPFISNLFRLFCPYLSYVYIYIYICIPINKSGHSNVHYWHLT